MLHTLRGQLSHAEWVPLLLVPREAGECPLASPAFIVLSPVLSDMPLRGRTWATTTSLMLCSNRGYHKT